jgi:hypothetical protein
MQDNLILLLMGVLIAVLGSSAKFVHKLGKKPFSWVMFLSSVLTSAFLGLLVGLVCLNYEISLYLTLAATGVAGWSGHQLMDVIAQKMEGYVAKKIDSK